MRLPRAKALAMKGKRERSLAMKGKWKICHIGTPASGYKRISHPSLSVFICG
ncbi:MAG: hypothetical protein NTX36_14780 [Proteobacteria bacterium]|nr:hypothetical protein [Pseudomonadota bacterium]